jgi:hypothetical protein
MAYKFDPVINTYVDPKSVEISKTLNERFAQNFAVNDALNTAIRDMQFAPFENDSALAKQAREEADAKLKQIAERGDYENMTFPLHTLAKETGNRLKPLADNYSRYANTLTDLNKRMQEGKVNAEQYDLYKSYMTRGYKGLEMDEMGRVKQGTEFSAPMLYNDPKVMDRITERLKIIHSKKTGSETSGYQRDAEGNLLAITQGGTLEKVDPADVQTAVDAVMQESDVKMYFDQMGTMKATKYSDAMGGPQALIATQTTNLQNQISKLNDLMNSGQYSGSQKRQMAESVKGLQNELTNIQGLKTPEEQLAYAKKSFVEEYQRPIYEYANLKAGVYEQTSKYSVKNITAEEKEKKQIEWDINHPELLKSGEILATQWGGKDTNEKLQNIQSIQTRIQELNNVITTGKENGVALSSQVLQERRAELEGLKNDRLNTEAQIKEGARKSISYNELQKQDPTLIDALSEYLGTKDVGTIYLKMQQIFDNTGDQDYLNFQTKFNQKYGENALTIHQKEYYSGRAELDKSFNQDSEQIAAENLGFTPSTSNIAQSDIISVFQSAFQNKVDKGLSEVKIGGVWSVNRIPGLTEADTRAFTTAFDKLLLNKPLASDIIYKDASGNEITDIEGATIVEYNAPVYGTNLMSLNIVQGDNKTPKTIYMDMNQITSPQLKQIYNSNSFKLASRMTQLGSVSQYDLKLNTINTQTGDYGIPFTLRFNDTRGSGKPLVTVLTNDGKPVPANWFTDRGMAPITKAVDPNSQLFKDFIEKPFLQVN